ncbi:MAG: LysR family transcriptional regulator, partial [Cyanobacteria bacterium J06639_1]
MELSALEIFAEVMQRGSFAAVARDRQVDPSSISRAIATLESKLGVRLFQRSTRRLVPTEAGNAYFERVISIVDQLSRAGQIAADMSDRPRGTLRVTAPVTFGQIAIVPLLPELAEMYPDLAIELLLADVTVDLLAERIDVALRLGSLSDSSFVAVHLCPMVSVVCAAPAYLEREGWPRSPQDLSHHNCLRFPMSGWVSQWHFRSEDGAIAIVPVSGRCTISNALALKQCALAGMGVTLLPTWIVTNELNTGILLDVFPEFDVTATEFDSSAWLLYPSREYLPL